MPAYIRLVGGRLDDKAVEEYCGEEGVHWDAGMTVNIDNLAKLALYISASEPGDVERVRGASQHQGD